MPEVSPAVCTCHLDALHVVRNVVVESDGAGQGGVEAWPAAVRIELRLGIEKCRPAVGAYIRAIGCVVEPFARIGCLSRFVEKHFLLLFSKIGILHCYSIPQPSALLVFVLFESRLFV